MLNLVKAEFYKLKTSKAFLVLILLNIVQSILCPIIFSKARVMTGKEALMNVFAAQEFIGLFFSQQCLQVIIYAMIFILDV